MTMPKNVRKGLHDGRLSRHDSHDVLATSSLFPEVVMDDSFSNTRDNALALDKVCRLCMVRGGPTMEHIFHNSGSNSIAAQITWVTQLEMHEEEALPSRICQQCIFRLTLSQNFKQQCVTSDRALRDLFLTKEPVEIPSVAAPSHSNASITSLDGRGHTSPNQNYNLKVEPLSPCSIQCDDAAKDDTQLTPADDFKIEIVEHNLDDTNASSFDRDGITTRNVANNPSHKDQKGGTAPFLCADCSKTFPTWDQLRRHRVYHSEKRVPCPQCDRKFLRRAQLARHLLWHSGEKPFPCPECSKRFAAQTTLDVHMRSHTGLKLFKCHLCDKTFGHNSTLTTHIRTHTGDRPYQCPSCPQSFTAKSPLTKHIRTHTGFKPHKCPECPLTFTLPGSLRGHMRTHTGERPYSCPHCDKTFAQPGGLKNHVRIHTGSRPYECEICHKTYRQQGAYSIHMRTHTNVRPYSCEVCSKSFNVKKTLARHIKVHTGERKFKCLVCKQRFAREDGLANHTLIHKNEKPFECVTCNKAFRQKVALVLHMRCHTGERPYKCVHCEMTFAQKGTMTTHLRLHTGERPYQCTQCEKTCTQLGNLLDHKRRHHPYGEDVEYDESIEELLANTDGEDECQEESEEDPLDVSEGEKTVEANGIGEEMPVKTDEIPEEEDSSYTCELCSKTFLQLKSLMWHTEKYHAHQEETPVVKKSTKKNRKKKKSKAYNSKTSPSLEKVTSTHVDIVKDFELITDNVERQQLADDSVGVRNTGNVITSTELSTSTKTDSVPIVIAGLSFVEN